MSPETQLQIDTDESQSLVLQAQNVTVTNAETYAAAANLRAHIKTAREYFENLFRPRIDEAHKHHKGLLADLKRFDDPLKSAFDRIGGLLVAYDTEQERLRKAEQARLEREREDAKKRQADIAKEAGQKQLAREILQRPAEPVVAPKMTPKIAGLHFSTRKSYEVVDFMKLVKAVAAGKVPITALTYDSSFLGKRATSDHDGINPDADGVRWLFPGVKVFEVKGTVQK